MSTVLSPFASDLMRALTGSGEPGVDAARLAALELTDRELGTLLPAARRVRHGHPAHRVSMAITSACQRRQPAFTPESFTALVAALLAGSTALGTWLTGDSVLAANALLRCDGPPPPEAARLAGDLVTGELRRGQPLHRYALMALASLDGTPPRKIAKKTADGALHPIAEDEAEVMFALGPAAMALLAELSGDSAYGSPPELPDAWDRLAALPDYAMFARRALESARARVDDVHAGRIAYRADAAFAKDEVSALGRAVRVALLLDAPWLLDALRPLLLGVAVAPTAARTLPSQALLYEVARAAEQLPTPEVLEALRAARAVARHKGVHQQLDRKLQRVNRALGDRPDVAFRLPDLGFDRDGFHLVPVGAHQAVVTLADGAGLSWRRPDGRVSATVPAGVRRDHPEAVTELRALVRQVRGHVGTLSRVLESGLSASVTLPYRRWQQELAANGLGWSVVQRLIWELPAGDGRWRAALPTDAGFTDVAGVPVPEPAPDAEIRLWHPLTATPGEIRAWRDLVTDRELRQPFKQAFRELYLLTPAEAETGDYSNRFAAHIVHYRRLYALMKGRGWSTSLLGPWDGGDSADATRVVAAGRWRVTFRHDYREEQASTDRVRFDRRAGGAWRPAPLTEVPAVVFSEAMREVDLFVAVTSISADPHWIDRGDELYADYWREASSAELTATAQVRRSALARILPRTKIADRCELTDRHLVVRGELCTYRIHLGSGNVLMEPGSRYLCIVPAARGPRAPVFVPFEEDRLTLILSKAFLLADDTHITDPSIRAQMKV